MVLTLIWIFFFSPFSFLNSGLIGIRIVWGCGNFVILLIIRRLTCCHRVGNVFLNRKIHKIIPFRSCLAVLFELLVPFPKAKVKITQNTWWWNIIRFITPFGSSNLSMPCISLKKFKKISCRRCIFVIIFYLSLMMVFGLESRCGGCKWEARPLSKHRAIVVRISRFVGD